MIVRKLPLPDTFSAHGQTLVFSDHTLFTTTTQSPYRSPEHQAGMGILTMQSGIGHLILNHEKEILDQHHFLLINKGSRLSIRLPHAGAQPLFLFFATPMAEEVLDKRGIDWSWLERLHPLSDRLRHDLGWLVSIGDSCSSFGALKADSMIRGMLEDISVQAQAAAAISNELQVTGLETRVRLFKRLSLAREWILKNYASPITLRDMAKIAALNSQHFLRMFRDCFGITPHRFLTDTRLEMARRSLLQTRESVSVICRLSGFESLSSFSWLFRQRFGSSPSGYRLSKPAATHLTQ
jgi:AraC family transcriptional regulator